MPGMGERTYATPSSVVDPPQPIMIAAKVVAEMTNLSCQQLILSYSKLSSYPINPRGVGFANRFRKSPTAAVFGVK